MCGIFGATGKLGEDAVSRMIALLDHRGPDSNGWTAFDTPGGGMTFAHTRLAIQDLSASGHQPMTSASGRWVITFNGEIYNHLELRPALDVSWRGSSDTETLIEYIDAFGIDRAVREMNGIFAFGAWDHQTSTLYVVRDPFGVKPVYYSTAGGGFVFSSEMKPVLAHLDRGARLSSEALSTFLTLRYVPSPGTLVDGVDRLPPGHVLTMAPGRSPQIAPYVTSNPASFEGSMAEAVDAYRTALSDAVRRQLISDVPVGVLLSGGIDSAIIAAMAREHSSDLRAFTVGFGERYEECEIEDARETARTLDIAFESVEVQPEGLIDTLADIIASVEEPLGTTSIMPMWYLTRLARKHATVVLAGQGNDEPWGGYRRYQIELLMARYRMLRSAPFRLAGQAGRFTRSDGIRRGLQCLGESDVIERFVRAYSLFDAAELTSLGIAASSVGRERIDYWLNMMSVDGINDADRMMRIDSRMNLADDLLLYGDKVSMSCALEVRVPMLDPEVVSLVESLPLDYRANLSQTKIVHRAMAESWLPASIINRPKKGFQVPFGRWAKSVWRDYVEANLLDANLEIHDALDPVGLRTIWARHQSGRFDYSRQLFALLTLSLWMQRYLTGASRADDVA